MPITISSSPKSASPTQSVFLTASSQAHNASRGSTSAPSKSRAKDRWSNSVSDSNTRIEDLDNTLWASGDNTNNKDDSSPRKKTPEEVILELEDGYTVGVNKPRWESDPVTWVDYDNGLAITDTQHSLIEKLGSDYEKSKMFNQLWNHCEAPNLSIDVHELLAR